MGFMRAFLRRNVEVHERELPEERFRGGFDGGPVGLSTLAVAVGEERETVEEVAEPFLVREGLLARTPRGRVATPAAWTHLGLTPPRGMTGGNGQQDLFGA